MIHNKRQLMDALETHSVEGIEALLREGFDPSVPVDGKSPIRWLTEMYTRSDRFPDCMRLLLKSGAVLEDPVMEPVLLDDTQLLADALARDPTLVHRRTNMTAAFTPLVGATPLHVACEYGHLNTARLLLAAGADPNARAAVDQFGLGGQTPIFHTVNSNGNRSQPLLGLLLKAGASCDVRLSGITWGRGFDWETTLFDVTPVSYAQFGLLPQMHRVEADIYSNIELLLKASGRTVPPLANVPNRYLRS